MDDEPKVDHWSSYDTQEYQRILLEGLTEFREENHEVHGEQKEAERTSKHDVLPW